MEKSIRQAKRQDKVSMIADIEMPQTGKDGLGRIMVLIVDDQAVLRDGLRALLNLYDDIWIIGEASEAEEAIDKAQEFNPDVIVIDMAMPGLGGLEATRRIIKRNPKARVLVLTQYDDREHVISSIKAGASGYISKRASGAEVVSAIRAVHHGEYFLYPSAASTLIRDYLLHQSENEPYDCLTNREREVLRMIVEGQTSRQIADRLSISLKTVLGHRGKMMKKLALHNRTELIKYAIRKGLVEMDKWMKDT
ncbi:response regulator [Chloroflexota bacterium]